MTRLRSGPLVAWAAAWLAGHVASDDVLRIVCRPGEAHSVVDLPDQDGPAPLSAVLIHWRRAGATPWLVLPVPGDVTGLSGPPAFRSTALHAGEAIMSTGLGIVPEVIDIPISSAPPRIVWRCFPFAGPPIPTALSLADAQYELTESIRESASALAELEVAGSSQDVSAALNAARRAGERLRLPEGFPPRAVQLIAQAERLRQVLEIATADPIGGAVDRQGISARADILRPLANALRRAQVAGYNALSEQLVRSRR